MAAPASRRWGRRLSCMPLISFSLTSRSSFVSSWRALVASFPSRSSVQRVVGGANRTDISRLNIAVRRRESQRSHLDRGDHHRTFDMRPFVGDRGHVVSLARIQQAVVPPGSLPLYHVPNHSNHDRASYQHHLQTRSQSARQLPCVGVARGRKTETLTSYA